MSAGPGKHPSRTAAWELPLRAPASVAVGRTHRVGDYVLLRLTGLVLSVLVLGHFVVTHFVTDVAHDDASFVARRLSSGLWVAWDSTMLAAALVHGSIGAKLALADYASGHRRLLLQRSVVVLATGLFVVGAMAIARAAHV